MRTHLEPLYDFAQNSVDSSRIAKILGELGLDGAKRHAFVRWKSGYSNGAGAAAHLEVCNLLLVLRRTPANVHEGSLKFAVRKGTAAQYETTCVRAGSASESTHFSGAASPSSPASVEDAAAVLNIELRSMGVLVLSSGGGERDKDDRAWWWRDEKAMSSQGRKGVSQAQRRVGMKYS